MIVTNLDNIGRYVGANHVLDIALNYVMNSDLSLLHIGRNEVSGDDVFINLLSYDSLSEDDAIWEGHLAYGDIHIILEGHERIGINDPDKLTEISRNIDDDFIGYSGPAKTWVHVMPGDVVIVFPEDIHKPKVIDVEPCRVKRAVVKFKV